MGAGVPMASPLHGCLLDTRPGWGVRTEPTHRSTHAEVVHVAEHVLERGRVHYKWDNSLAPAIEVEPGDVVHFETEEVTDGQITAGCPASLLGQLDFNRLYPLAGPVLVKGAEPGD